MRAIKWSTAQNAAQIVITPATAKPTIHTSNSLFVPNIKVSFGRFQVALEPAIGLLDGIVFVAGLAHEQRPGWRGVTLQRAAAFRAFAGWEQARHGV